MAPPPAHDRPVGTKLAGERDLPGRPGVLEGVEVDPDGDRRGLVELDEPLEQVGIGAADPATLAVDDRPDPGCGVVIGQHVGGPRAPHRAHLDPDPWLCLEIAHVVGLEAPLGHEPERVAIEPVAHRGVPDLPGPSSSGLGQRLWA